MNFERMSSLDPRQTMASTVLTSYSEEKTSQTCLYYTRLISYYFYSCDHISDHVIT